MITVRIGGWAGQGTVLAGTILGKSLSLEQDYEVVQRRSYSAAVRSGIAYSDIIADRQKVDELTIEIPQYLIVLYQETLNEWRDKVEGCEHLIVDSSRVEEVSKSKGKVYRVPAGEIAEEIASSKAANIVLLGALAQISKEIDLDCLIKTIRSEFPEKYKKMNIEAVKKGYEYFDEVHTKG
ncbi:MAG: 2-oxoacid:acceptor oxidoreductase family protein [Candidatus Saliniplasma sp.]